MTRSNTNDDEQSYQLSVSRRNLLRAGGAAAGVGVAGGIPSLSSAVEQPVGRSDAAVPVVIASAAAFTGLAIAGKFAYDKWVAPDAEEIADTAYGSNIYQIVESSINQQQFSLAQERDKLGVDDSWTQSQPDANGAAHSMMESGTTAISQAWVDGLSRGEAENKFLQAIRVQSASSEFNVIGLWNSFCTSIVSALLTHFNNESDLSQNYITMDANLPDLLKPYPGKTPKHSMVDMSLDGAGSEFSLLGLRDYSSYLPADIDNIPDDEQPPNGYRIAELFTHVTCCSPGNGRIISPVANAPGFWGEDSIGSDYQDTSQSFQYAYDHSGGFTLKVVDGGGNSATYEITKWIWTLIDAVRKIRNNIESNSTTTVDKLYTGLENGDITPSDLVSGRQLYQEYDPSDSYTRSQVELIAIGGIAPPDGMTDATVEVSGQSYTGVLFIDIPSGTSVELCVGDTIAAGDYNQATLAPKDGSQRMRWTDKDISITAVDGSDSGCLNYEGRERIGPDGIDESKVESRISELQETNSELEEKLKELEESQDGPLGGGGVGLDGILGDNGLLLAGGGVVAAYLLGR